MIWLLLVTSTWQVYFCLFFYIYILYKVLVGLKLIHSTLHPTPMLEAMAEVQT